MKFHDCKTMNNGLFLALPLAKGTPVGGFAFRTTV